MNEMLDLSGTYRLFDEMKSVHLFPGTSEGRWGTRLREQGRGKLWDLPKDTAHHWETRPEAKWSLGSQATFWNVGEQT